MEEINVINSIIKNSGINILIYVVFLKLINYKENDYKKTLVIVGVSVLEAVLGKLILRNIGLLLTLLIIYILYGLIVSKIINKNEMYSITITAISFAIVYVCYAISIIVSALLLKLIYPSIQKGSTIIIICAIMIAYMILCCIGKIKRFKNGVSFLKNETRINNIGILGLCFIGMTTIIYSCLGNSPGTKYSTYLFVGIIIEAICLTIWIRRKITKYYKQKMKEKTIEELENEIKEKNEEINKILEENKTIATINHKYSSRIKALEKFSAEILERPKLIAKMKEEFGAEFGDIQNTIRKLSEEFTKEMNDKIKSSNKLVKTGIFGIDNILEYMKSDAEKNKIKFDLKINGNINYMIENVISQNKLETLLGDHIKDAIIAIKHSDNTYKSILTVIGIIDDCYEICIYDTGIEFEIETLIKLGTEAITTHKETGGSGIGFMTTFETLKETKASLIIEEKHPMNNKDYTKAVKIRFDGKNEYRIKSYRAEEIRKQDKEKRIYFL